MIRNVIFNGKPGDRSLIKSWVNALNNPRIVTEKAGFLFKVTLNDDQVELAVAPCMINGERLCHYNMKMKQEDAYTLIGDVNATGLFTILFKPESLPLCETQKERYVNNFQQFAKLLLEHGYSEKGRLNEVTQSILEEVGLHPAPQTLAELDPSA